MAERQAEGRLWRDSAGRGYATGSGEPSRQFGREVATLHLHFGATMKWGGKGNSCVILCTLLDRSELPFSIYKVNIILTLYTYGKDEMRKHL